MVNESISHLTGKQFERLRYPYAYRSLDSTIKLLKTGVWIYFFLLIFEGALRKWIIPGLQGPLIVIRDPIALWLVFTAWNRGLLPSTAYLWGMMFIGVSATFTALFFGHGNLAVALFGARIFLLHFPLIFIIGRIFNREDLYKLGKIVLWSAFPMLLLILWQFYSPQSAWVNRGVGGDTSGAGFQGALGFYRPPGTFAFTNGTTLFFSLVSVYVFAFWLDPKRVNRFLLLLASLVLIISIPIAMSRALFYQILICVFFAIIACFFKPGYVGKMFTAFFFLLVFVLVLSQTALFETLTKPFMARFESASDSEGGVKGTLVNRFLGGMTGALDNSTEQPLFGFGIGMGTNAGSTLLAGKRTFLIAEEEWARMIGELGPILGLWVIAIRVGLVFKISGASLKRLIVQDALPWMFLSYGLLNFSEGGWAQPTALGFSIFIGGLMLASLKIFPDLNPR